MQYTDVCQDGRSNTAKAGSKGENRAGRSLSRINEWTLRNGSNTDHKRRDYIYLTILGQERIVSYCDMHYRLCEACKKIFKKDLNNTNGWKDACDRVSTQRNFYILARSRHSRSLLGTRGNRTDGAHPAAGKDLYMR